jgi:REP element-mobilizing transposase RayT
MTRALRVEFDGATYHVMSRGVAKMRTFLDDSHRRAFLDILGEVVAEGGLVVHAFCLMPNHYHLLCVTPEGQLGRWMHRVNAAYARAFNRAERRVGHVWQGRYKAIVVDEGRYFLECSRYVHLNPNRSKLTRPAERYPWSSYRTYVGGPACADWVSTERTLAEFGGDRKAYRAFVEAGRGERAVSPFERAVAGLVLGGEGLVRRVRDLLAGLDDDARLRLRALRRQGNATPEGVEAAVERLFADGLPRRRRTLRLYALRKHSSLRPVDVARRCGRSPAAVSLAVKRIDAEARSDPELARRLRALGEAVEAERGAAAAPARRRRTRRS